MGFVVIQAGDVGEAFATGMFKGFAYLTLYLFQGFDAVG